MTLREKLEEIKDGTAITGAEQAALLAVAKAAEEWKVSDEKHAEAAWQGISEHHIEDLRAKESALRDALSALADSLGVAR